VPRQPFWISDLTQPSGKALNPAAFSSPPVGQPGDSPRNGLRSPYSIDQTDLALRRRFSPTERVQLHVRAEYFNAFNHPMFGIPGSRSAPAALWPGPATNRLTLTYGLRWDTEVSLVFFSLYNAPVCSLVTTEDGLFSPTS
jgi:hypothetical protein